MDDPISAERLSHIVGLIYDCAIDPDRWSIAMDAIRTELDFQNATFDLVLLPSGTALQNVVCNIPPEYVAQMAGAGPAVIEQWGGEAVMWSLPMDRPAVLTHANPAFDPATSTNSYYLSFAKPQGIIDVLAIGLARDERAIGNLAFGRHSSAGPIGERELAIAGLLVPHLQRAATINRLLEGATLARATFAATLDQLASPVILVDASLQILHANPRATSLLSQNELVREKEGKVEACTPGASSALHAAVAQAVRNEGTIGRRGLGIPLSASNGPEGALYVLPLSTGRRQTDLGAVAAIFVAQIGSAFIAPTEMAAALFELTPTEARVFGYLVTGHSQTKTAEMLGIERSTLKTHLIRLYDKIGVRRQGDLVQVAASLAAPIDGAIGLS